MDIDELREKTRAFVKESSQSELSRLSDVPQSVISLFIAGAGLSVKNYTRLLKAVGA